MAAPSSRPASVLRGGSEQSGSSLPDPFRPSWLLICVEEQPALAQHSSWGSAWDGSRPPGGRPCCRMIDLLVHLGSPVCNYSPSLTLVLAQRDKRTQVIKSRNHDRPPVCCISVGHPASSQSNVPLMTAQVSPLLGKITYSPARVGSSWGASNESKGFQFLLWPCWLCDRRNL